MSNMLIAKSHRTSRKFVGHTMALASMLAIILSGLVVAAGVVTYAIFSFPTSIGWVAYVYWVLALVIGSILAVLIESFTLGSCARLRYTLEVRKEIVSRYNQVVNPTESIEAMKKREMNTLLPGTITDGFFIVLGVTISTLAGTLLWHLILSPLPNWQAWACSTLFSGLVSATLVVSELKKETNTRIIEESIIADNFTQLAAKEDARAEVIDSLHKQHKSKVTALAQGETFDAAILTEAETTLDEVLTGGTGQIPLRLQREREVKQIAMQQDRENTTRQLSLVRGNGNGLHMVSLPASDTITPTSRKDVTRNYQAIKGIYDTLGEQYIKEHIGELATKYKLSPRTIYRHLEAAKDASGEQKAIGK